MNERSASERRLIREAKDLLGDRLAGWRLDVREAEQSPIDAILSIEGPDGAKAVFLLEAKMLVEPRTAEQIASHFARTQKNGLVVAPFLSQRTQEILKDAGANYADLTGNIHLQNRSPAILIDTRGAERNPKQDRRIRKLKGPKAGRIVRALCDWMPPLRIQQIAQLAHTDVGYTSRVVDILDREALIHRVTRGPVLSADWQRLIRRLASEYSMLESNRTASFLEPRGLAALEQRLRQTDLRYLVTGSAAAYRIAPFAPPRLFTCYVDHIATAARELSLRETEAGANVILLEPADPLIFDQSWNNDGLRLAGLSQIAADLLTGPGRAPQEAEELFNWMSKNEEKWRAAP